MNALDLAVMKKFSELNPDTIFAGVDNEADEMKIVMAYALSGHNRLFICREYRIHKNCAIPEATQFVLSTIGANCYLYFKGQASTPQAVGVKSNCGKIIEEIDLWGDESENRTGTEIRAQYKKWSEELKRKYRLSEPSV
jgi:hypothetical protein